MIISPKWWAKAQKKRYAVLTGAMRTPADVYNSVKAGKGGTQLGDGSNKNKKSKVAPEPGEGGGGGGGEMKYPYETKAAGKSKKTHKVRATTHSDTYKYQG